jgi:uracil-DNA glycosylase
MPDKYSLVPILLERLHQKYPDARYELNWKTPEQLLVATILAAQCTDERVNQVTKTLFVKYPNPQAFADADLEELGNDIRPTGFFNNKAKAVKGACRVLVERFGGKVPRTMEEMLELPGVARKTANVVLNNAYKIPSGIIVDSHVARVSKRLGLTDSDKPERIEEDLMELVPQDEWIEFGCGMVLHGRYTCTAAAAKCPACMYDDVCPKVGVEAAGDDEPLFAQLDAPKGGPVKPPDQGEPAMRLNDIPPGWRSVLAGEFKRPYFKELKQFVDEERRHHTVYPPEDEVFTALKLTPYNNVNALLLGQDPYPGPNQAHGLCFSVKPGVKPPASLRNMFKELHDDLGCKIPNNGYLVPWAEQRLLMLNAVLTVRAGEPNSHAGKGWEQFTDAVIKDLNARDEPVVFVLWGNYAQKKAKLIDEDKHTILKAAHPSPLSVKKFFGSRPFSAINAALKKNGKPAIDWQIPDL